MFIISCTNSDNLKDFSNSHNNSISETRSQGNPCFNESQNNPTECEDIFITSHNVTLNTYPGCTFEVSFHYVKCFYQSNGEKQLFMDDFIILSHNCAQYNADVSAARLNGTLSEFTIDFEHEIWNQITLFALNIIGSTPGNAAVVNYFYNSCSNFCYFTASKNNFHYYYYEKTLCGDGCCSVWSRWVLDSNGWHFDAEIDNSSYPLICDDTEYVHSCGLGSIFNTECTYTCDIFLHE